MRHNEIETIHNEHSQLKYFLAGGFGGMCTVLLGYPFDTLKVKLQAMPVSASGAPLYTGTWDCAVKTVRKYGFFGLYKGMTVPLAGVAPVVAISFMAFSTGKKIANSADDAILTKLELFGAGAFSGFFTTAVMAPGERIKCLLQVQHDIITPKIYKGPVDVVRQLYRDGGVRSIFRGTVATLLRDVPGNGLYFMTYEWLQRQFNPTTSIDPSVSGTLVSGGLAGVVYWVVACPADVLKTRLQTAPEGTYRGLRDVLQQLLKKEGITALYKGSIPLMARSFPANAICFTGFEFAMHYLNKL